jgi:cytochrome b subunit of formate dehydrogenase
MLKKVILISSIITIGVGLAIFLLNDYRVILFHNLRWLIAGASCLGMLFGVYRGIKDKTSLKGSKGQPDRHTLDSFMEHWGTAVGIIILIISGIFLMAGFRLIFSKNLHFLGLIVALFFGSYFLFHFFISQKYRYLIPDYKDIIQGTIKKYLFRGKWKDTGKYLSSQKSSFLLFSILGIGIILSGAIKTLAFYFSVPLQLTLVATQSHDILARVFSVVLLIHILFVVISRSHRCLLPSFFTGKEK